MIKNERNQHFIAVLYKFCSVHSQETEERFGQLMKKEEESAMLVYLYYKTKTINMTHVNQSGKTISC